MTLEKSFSPGGTRLFNIWIATLPIHAKEVSKITALPAKEYVEDGLGRVFIALFTGPSGGRYSFRTYVEKPDKSTYISVENAKINSIQNDLEVCFGSLASSLIWSEHWLKIAPETE